MPTSRAVAASATLHQRWGHTEALDALQDRREQLARYGHLGHPTNRVVTRAGAT